MLSVHNLAARRGHARLFANLDFSVAAGQALVVTGANGSGKTTLLRILAGLSAPAEGSPQWAGTDYRPFDERIRAVVAFVGHAPALKDELTAEENLAALAALGGDRPDMRSLGDALEFVSLARQRALPARALSQGQRRRIGLARLRLAARPLWILDEPATALDTEGTALLEKLIDEHLRHGGIAIAATHQRLGLSGDRSARLSLS